ncbi:MAG: hypothetical protein CO141_00650 [Candidatus Moranbacteria bacterium CG_4_9_14_3_um_filter_42_9]|nr:MAG: hypothetical protein CO141_00650 [Candidatus Moranbacteria bacterium CG_4_9_14_3_um_filter_42_9]
MESTAPVSAPSATPQPPQEPAPAATPKKSYVWAWLLGSCLGIAILGFIALGALGWWGARKIKNEIQKKGPNIEQLKENVEKINREGAEWEKKSKELRESLPSQEDFPSELPSL